MTTYKELHLLDLTEYLQHGVKTKQSICPRCKKGNNVYHIMPWDFRKVCTKCEITWEENNN